MYSWKLSNLESVLTLIRGFLGVWSKTADVKTADVVENGRCRAKTADVGVKTADVWVKAADVRTKTADV